MDALKVVLLAWQISSLKKKGSEVRVRGQGIDPPDPSLRVGPIPQKRINRRKDLCLDNACNRHKRVNIKSHSFQDGNSLTLLK